MGSLFIDDEEFLQKICGILNDHMGLSISDIGNLDIPYRDPLAPGSD